MLRGTGTWAAMVVAVGLMMLAGGCVEGGGRQVDGVTGASWQAEATPEEMAAADAQLRAMGVKKLTAEALLGEMGSEGSPVVVNVLDAVSYGKMHIKGSINMPYRELDGLAAKLLPDKGVKVVVYCGSYHCELSVKAARRLKELGYVDVREYRGGIKEWWQKGFPVGGSAAAG